ncbi:hypothetical protein [Polaribacter sp. IC073]|uniref:hypothetical protein n=1 Tax=Polaribacter sp. IC073 TaxID=2508540 RepID=UPI0011BE80F2|nr:hypothetical protein [Polaribacter sp. IC073]TXD45756.1 hypothetical protein ES045_16130 [Polaribacter sp. IC073]
MFEKIWTSPVWSKVISAGIIGIIGFISAIIYSLITDMNPIDSFKYIWNFKTKIGYAFIALIFMFIIQLLLQKVFSKKEKKLNKTEQKAKHFCEQWYKINDDQTNVVYRFNTYISSYTKQPIIANLTAFCKNHNGQEFKMNWIGGCLDRSCANNNKISRESVVKDLIESQLVVEWEKINGKY